MDGRGHTWSLDADLVLADNKYVSSRHCSIQLDEEGVVWLQDTRQGSKQADITVTLPMHLCLQHKWYSRQWSCSQER